MPTQRYIALQMLQDRALWEIRGPRTRRASTADLRRRSSIDSVLAAHHSARSASTHRPAGKLVESTSDLSLLVAYVEDHDLINEGPLLDTGARNEVGAAGDVTKPVASNKSLPEDEEVEEEQDEEVKTVLTLEEEEELLDYHDDHEKVLEGRWQLSKEVMFMVSAFLVLFASGGLILGFGPVYSMLVRENQWSELCTEEERQEAGDGVLCAAQEVRLQFVFLTGFLCLSAANAFFGYSLVGAGGTGAYLAAFQILQLYEVQGVVCSTLSSLFNCSGYVYMLLGLHGITRTVFFRVYGVLVSVGAFVCFLLFPTNNITRPRDFLTIPLCHIEVPRINTPIGLVDGMREELKRQDLWFFALLFGWVSLIFAFAGGAIPSLLVKLAGDDTNAASFFSDILYPVLVNGTFGYSPIVGYVIDHYGFKVIFLACIALVQLFIALLLIPSLRVQLVMFVVYAMAQTCLYALQFAYIIMCFPAELYGTLQAFLATVSFAFGLLNFAINPWTQIYFDGSYTVVLLFLGLPTILFYGFIHVVQGCEHHTVSHKTRRSLLPGNRSLRRVPDFYRPASHEKFVPV
ncbi:hypothetical protein PF005_g20046 [Phytophthora fragariae]|uniref:Major facilitator superfamily (MFS) profile domain-containing protein n=1 Tax=Phytophthora fragariae TaxID=53985 RepID=A0A6A3WVQ8_9STRA|nr:hypothetical protein PF009_g21424 [Phytophthora fragariae]KAE9087170.1 hypothetical protein PF010_g19825 [Phytophthora fragariae]KAE9091843.1 hypothetical protein PF007_g18735 [Phytophthora fragariae]KAE9116933.1 hypothetical protein PF006_g18931 [Phytophthora fragariae]KAE9188465.1 hypothetical protein PF005_g20046 [Phytophthora fragariae]